MRRAIALLTATLALAAAGTADARDRFATSLFSLIPVPGFPAHAYVGPNGHVYEGTYTNPNGDTVPSRVFEFDGNGALLDSWTIQGQDLVAEHGVQVATMDGDGRLVLLDKAPARVLLIDRFNDRQATYASFPESAGAIPNYAAWGPDGSLYVTDYAKPVIWRVPPGGGTPVEWLRDVRLDGGEFGTTGLKLQADRKTLLVAQQSEAGGGAGNPSTGRIFSVPIGADGKPGPMRQFWESRPADGPDGFAIAKSGNVYIALLVPNQLAVIGPDGQEKERFPSVPGPGDNGGPVPFDSPSSVNFLGTRLMVANQSYFSGDRTHQAILDVEAGEEGLPELRPAKAATAPKAKAKKKKAKRKKRKTRRKRRARRG